MSVIAKLRIWSVTKFGTGNLSVLNCVCDNDLMAAYATSEEDKLFSKYSPSGEMKLSTPDGFMLGSAGDQFAPGDAFYVMVLAADEAPDNADDPAVRLFPGAAMCMEARCYALTDFGGTKEVQFVAGKQPHRAVEAFAWKMMVDNPGATGQFKPGEAYWIALYPAAKFDRDGSIYAAHHAQVA